MKSSEFKKILKPLIKQCVRECILEEGILSGIISEVAKGMSGASVIVESNSIHKNNQEQEQLTRREQEYEKQRQERIKRLNESTKMQTNVFENVKQMREERSTPSPLSGTPSDSAGVDIAGILNLANGKWGELIK
jgi:hypothetical protein